MTKGERFYAKDGGYAFFSGRDGTRAFITGEFNETGAEPPRAPRHPSVAAHPVRCGKASVVQAWWTTSSAWSRPT